MTMPKNIREALQQALKLLASDDFKRDGMTRDEAIRIVEEATKKVEAEIAKNLAR